MPGAGGVTLLHCQSVSWSVENRQILDQVSFDLKKGEPLLILGPSGSGKTTLLSLLAGLISPSAGSVRYNDQDLSAMSRSDLDQFRGQEMGFVFQTLHLIGFLTVRQNLLLAVSLPEKDIPETKIDQTLKRLGLLELSDQKAGKLSTGEAQRLAVARAVVGSPGWIFCDEPTSALDDANAEAMINLLKNEADLCGASLIIVTHDKRVRNAFEGRACLELEKREARA